MAVLGGLLGTCGVVVGLAALASEPEAANADTASAANADAPTPPIARPAAPRVALEELHDSRWLLVDADDDE